MLMPMVFNLLCYEPYFIFRVLKVLWLRVSSTREGLGCGWKKSRFEYDARLTIDRVVGWNGLIKMDWL